MAPPAGTATAAGPPQAGGAEAAAAAAPPPVDLDAVVSDCRCFEGFWRYLHILFLQEAAQETIDEEVESGNC